MPQDRFSSAGSAFQSQQARDFTANDQALARLIEVEAFCKTGIKSFYEAANLGRPDVYVDMPSEKQVSISYGFRQDREGNIVRGPFATIFVMPEGQILLSIDPRWKNQNLNTLLKDPVPLSNEHWQDALTEWLIDFLTSSENTYRSLRY